MVEVLYGCGLRVSELIELKISDINFKEGFLKVEGKGQEVRYVPLAKYTSHLIKNYIENVRINNKINKNTKRHLFLNSRGSSMSRVIVLLLSKNWQTKQESEKHFSAHFSSFFLQLICYKMAQIYVLYKKCLVILALPLLKFTPT